MASDRQTIAWERLAPPPRHVPRAVQARVRSAEIKNALNPRTGSGSFGLWLLLVGVFIIVFGAVWFYAADEENNPVIGVFLAAAGIGILIALGLLIYVRGTRKIHLLRNGVTAPGTITKVSRQLSFLDFDKAVKDWEPVRKRFPEKIFGTKRFSERILSSLHSQLKFIPCKVRVAIGDAAANYELKVRVDLSSLATQQPRDAKIRVLCDPPNLSEGIDTGDFYPGVTISADGQWAIEGAARFLVFVSSFLRSSVPVVATYLWAALGLTVFAGAVPANEMVKESLFMRAGTVSLFTITHAVVPVFLFRLFLDFVPRSADVVDNYIRVLLAVIRGMIWFLFVVWFCVPIVALAYFTGWLTLVWSAVHIALAKRGTRQWAFLEYGSTSFALLLFLLCFSEEGLFPMGLAVVVLQALLLAVLNLKARKRWLSHGTEME